MDLTIWIVTSAALLDSINPCAISVLLLTIGFLLSLGKMRKEVLTIGFTYIFGLYLTYLFIGLGVLRALTVFGFPNVLARIGATILAITALINLSNSIVPNFPIKLKMPAKTHRVIARCMSQVSYPSAFILGILVGLFEFPCTGGPYLSILSLLHDKATFMTGFVYLLYYNFVFVLPLLVILPTANSAIVLARIEYLRKQYTKSVDIVTSILMLFLAIVIFLSA